jgi:prevent-host-death family protein
MIVTLHQARERLFELVERAYQGEDILITVRGKVRARLTRALPEVTASDRQTWVADLRQLQAEVGQDMQTLRSEDILSEDRAR